MSNITRALVIGASGSIGDAIVKQLTLSTNYGEVIAVSRQLPTSPIKGANYHLVDSDNEGAIADFCLRVRQKNIPFSLIICCVGALHGTLDTGQQIRPEKRLEDMSAENLEFYFHLNTVIPALWLKHVEPLLKGNHPATLVFLSARVGSISDNKLGGWYGYRAAKAALNMLIKTAQIEFQRRAKNVCLVSYHPGTVDSKLSKPFQHNVKPEKLFTADFTAQQLLAQLDNFSAADGPYFIDWNTKLIPW